MKAPEVTHCPFCGELVDVKVQFNFPAQTTVEFICPNHSAVSIDVNSDSNSSIRRLER